MQNRQGMARRFMTTSQEKEKEGRCSRECEVVKKISGHGSAGNVKETVEPRSTSTLSGLV